jgi:hypothetical protein
MPAQNPDFWLNDPRLLKSSLKFPNPTIYTWPASRLYWLTIYRPRVYRAESLPADSLLAKDLPAQSLLANDLLVKSTDLGLPVSSLPAEGSTGQESTVLRSTNLEG